MSTDGQRTKRRRNIAENFNRLRRVHGRFRPVDGRETAYSERQRTVSSVLILPSFLDGVCNLCVCVCVFFFIRAAVKAFSLACLADYCFITLQVFILWQINVNMIHYQAVWSHRSNGDR